MTKVRPRGEDVRTFILSNIEEHSADIAKLAADKFDVTRQAIAKHLRKLVDEGAIVESGKTRNRQYKLAALTEWKKSYKLEKGLAEDIVWTVDLTPVLGGMPDNVKRIWQYGFTEMFNNAIDHSEGTSIMVCVTKTAATTEIWVIDNGIGIFKRIQSKLGLLDERHAIFELSKGKLTTDPKNHSGEGIFFSSRAFDQFIIKSGDVYFSHNFGKDEDWILDSTHLPMKGTAVIMKLNNHTARTLKHVFDTYSSGDDYGFNKTVVPVALAQYGDDNLISRSQAKRLLARVELFKTVVFDFTGVESIGQAFADEIFRVFAAQHAEIELFAIHANKEVAQMIQRAKSNQLT